MSNKTFVNTPNCIEFCYGRITIWTACCVQTDGTTKECSHSAHAAAALRARRLETRKRLFVNNTLICRHRRGNFASCLLSEMHNLDRCCAGSATTTVLWVQSTTENTGGGTTAGCSLPKYAGCFFNFFLRLYTFVVKKH